MVQGHRAEREADLGLAGQCETQLLLPTISLHAQFDLMQLKPSYIRVFRKSKFSENWVVLFLK